MHVLSPAASQQRVMPLASPEPETPPGIETIPTHP